MARGLSRCFTICWWRRQNDIPRLPAATFRPAKRRVGTGDLTGQLTSRRHTPGHEVDRPTGRHCHMIAPPPTRQRRVGKAAIPAKAWVGVGHLRHLVDGRRRERPEPSAFERIGGNLRDPRTNSAPRRRDPRHIAIAGDVRTAVQADESNGGGHEAATWDGCFVRLEAGSGEGAAAGASTNPAASGGVQSTPLFVASRQTARCCSRGMPRRVQLPTWVTLKLSAAATAVGPPRALMRSSARMTRIIYT